MMKNIRYVLVALGLTLMSSHAHSQTLTAYDLTTATAGPSYLGNQAYSGTVGMQFDVNAPGILVTSLGVFDGGQDGFHHVLTTYLFDRDTHALLASQTFDGTDPGTLVGYHRFKDIPGGLVLNTGHYVIAAGGFMDDFAGSDLLGNATLPGFVPDTFNDGGGVISSVGTGLYAEVAQGPGFYPGSPLDGNLAFNAGSFQYSLFVPEPGSVALACSMLGVGGSLAARRRRRRFAKKTA